MLLKKQSLHQINEEFKYVTTFIDDYSQYMITYLLKRKFNLKDELWNYLKLMKIWDISIH